MATGVKPRDQESNLTRADLEAIHDAMKCKKFRELLNEYCEEVRDPANQAIYQKEMTQLEKERGYDVTFINPKEGYVIKTSVAGDRKAFVNICSNPNVEKPTCTVHEQNGQKGMNWSLPYSIIPPREDVDQKKNRCVIYDVVFHPDTLRMAEVNKRFRELVNKTAFEGLQKTYGIHLDSNNCRFPKSFYKGMKIPAVIRKEDPDYVPPSNEENQEMSPELVEKLYPQQVYTQKEETIIENTGNINKQHRKKTKNSKKEYNNSFENGYTVPNYVITQQKNVDLQDYTYHKESKRYSTIPSQIVVTINLPLLSSTKDCVLDVREKSLDFISEKPAKYKLNVTLPYAVNAESGSAKFDNTKHILTVTLPVMTILPNGSIFIRNDSGIDSENNSFDEEECSKSLIEEMEESTFQTPEKSIILSKKDDFLQSTVGYLFPTYTFNVLDNIIAFTFHVKNTEPDSVMVKNEDGQISIKFSTLGAGFVPNHYAAIIVFNADIKFEDINGEAWDNNVILQIELKGTVPEKFLIGLGGDDMIEENFDLSLVKASVVNDVPTQSQEDTVSLVEVTNLRTETNIVVSSTKNEEIDDYKDNIVWTDSMTSDSGAKSILRKPITMMRSFSESSAGDVASSMDYISSDCIPEESSLKKTVRFNDVIAKQFYRYNSSIEGQKKKNQRKKSKKRSQDRRKSESEAEDDTSSQEYKPRLKSVLKQRHDSGLADTSDAEGDYKIAFSDSDAPYEKLEYTEYTDNMNDVFAVLNIGNKSKKGKKSMRRASVDTDDENVKKHDTNVHKDKSFNNVEHNTVFYNPDKLNKGQYLEVVFKNDLIFELDM